MPDTNNTQPTNNVLENAGIVGDGSAAQRQRLPAAQPAAAPDQRHAIEPEQHAGRDADLRRGPVMAAPRSAAGSNPRGSPLPGSAAEPHPRRRPEGCLRLAGFASGAGHG